MNESQTPQCFIIYFLRILTILFIVAYFRELNWIAVSSGDFGLGPKVLGLGIAMACNVGLWFATISMTKIFRVLVLILLVPTFLITPLLIASRYHFLLSIVVVLSAIIAVYNLFSDRLYA